MSKIINKFKENTIHIFFSRESGGFRYFLILTFFLPFTKVIAQTTGGTFSNSLGQNTIAFDGKDLSVDRQAFLSQHDIVYLSPTAEGYEGFPIGNGDLGAMAWTPPDKLFFQINKTNTWDDAPEGMFSPWEDRNNPEKSELFTSLRSCGQLMIEPGLPVFDWMFLQDFEGRLSLSDAQASWKANGPLGNIQCRSFIADGDLPVMVVHYEDELNEPVERRVKLARWGSRVFEHWYQFFRRDFHLGNNGTKTGHEGDEAWIEQSTRSLKFVMAVKLVGPEVNAKQFNSRETGYIMNTGKRCSFDLYLSVVTSEEADDPLAKARENVRAAAKVRTEKMYAAHKEQWADFWSKSFVDIPDDYLENLWYFNLYQVGSAARGDYPPHFINSIWSWNRDVRPWNHYYQWNQQIYTWPLHTSGHSELMMPYAKWKLEGLDKAIETAKHVHGIDGAFYSDVSDRRGNQGVGEGASEVSNSFGSTGLMAIDLWRHYQYTLDKDYLKEYAYPIMLEVVRLYTNLLEKRENGLYHIPKALPFESPKDRLSCNTTNDLAAIRNLFPAFVQAAKELKKDKELRAKAQEMFEKLAPFVLTTIPKEAKPWGPVNIGDTIIAYGTRLRTGLPGEPWVTRPYWLPNAPIEMPSSFHAINAQLTPVFPANLVTLDDKGTKLFNACRNMALSFDPLPNNGHSLIPICFARLGMAEYLPDLLDRWVDEFQFFSQGHFCYLKRDYIEYFDKNMHDEPYNIAEHKIRGLTNNVRVLFSDPEQRVELLRQPFAHMALEPGSIFEATINEMLLQSHGGKIHVFPAVPNNWAGRFKLHAQGGFEIISERAEGEVKYVAVKSLKGQPCCVANPWKAGEKVRVKLASSSKRILETADAPELNFKTDPGKVYIIERHKKPVSSFEYDTIVGNKNMKSKSKGRARLGIPRQF
ncbi:MAG: hypothetical protein MI975_00010 [Cytophagales bacterium]|nr:hypothetical protein [Cytophagales bacterium]